MTLFYRTTIDYGRNSALQSINVTNVANLNINVGDFIITQIGETHIIADTANITLRGGGLGKIVGADNIDIETHTGKLDIGIPVIVTGGNLYLGYETLKFAVLGQLKFSNKSSELYLRNYTQEESLILVLLIFFI